MERAKFRLNARNVMVMAISCAEIVAVVVKYFAMNVMVKEGSAVIGAMEQEETEAAFIAQALDSVIVGLAVFFAMAQEKTNVSHAMGMVIKTVMNVMGMA